MQGSIFRLCSIALGAMGFMWAMQARAVDLYVKPGGAASGACATTGTACNFAGVLQAIPRAYTQDYRVLVASGTYNEEVLIRGYKPQGSFTISFEGFINPSPNQWTDAPTLASVAVGTATNDHPTNAYTLLNAPSGPFGSVGSQAGNLLRIASGPGFAASNDLDNFYWIEANPSTTQIRIVGRWRSGTPTNATSVQVFNRANMPTINGGGTRNYGFQIVGSDGIRLRKLRFAGAKIAGVDMIASISDAGLPNDFASVVDCSSNADATGKTGVGMRIHANSRVGALTTGIFNGNYLQGLVIEDASSARSVDYSFFWGNTIDAGFLCSSTCEVRDVTNNWAKDNAYAGFDFEFTSSTFGFSYNRADLNDKAGIVVASSSSVNFYCRNTFDGNTGTGVMGGIWITRASDVSSSGTGTGCLGSLSEHQSTNNGGYGIRCERNAVCEACASFTLTGNAVGTYPSPALSGCQLP